MKLKKKILVLGASSFVGKQLFSRIGKENVLGTFCNNPVDGLFKFDSVKDDIGDLVKDSSQFSHAVILLGDTVPQTCAADIKRSQELNVDSIKRIIDYLIDNNIKPIFCSSEYVFDGKKGNYTEEDSANPILVYGKQKLEVEEYLKSQTDNYVILRLAKIYGAELGDKSILTNWVVDLLNKTELKCAQDQVFAPVYVGDVVESIIQSINGVYTGVFHVAGPKAYSRIDLLNMFIKKMKQYNAIDINVVPCSINDFGLNEVIPLDVSMNTDKLVSTMNIKLHDIEKIAQEVIEKQLQIVKG